MMRVHLHYFPLEDVFKRIGLSPRKSPFYKFSPFAKAVIVDGAKLAHCSRMIRV